MITAAKWACGPNVGGKIAVALNPYNIDAFIGSLLNLLNNSNFKYLRLLGDERGDERGDDSSEQSKAMSHTFTRLNEQLTVAVSLGLTMADIMLLPFEVLADYKKKTLEKDYAPTIAKHMMLTEQYQQTQLWVQNLPPETLAPLLTSLLVQHNYSVAENATQSWYDTKSNMGMLSNNEAQPQHETDDKHKVQLQAILQILEWIKPATSASEQEQQNKCSQFEKTLYRMGRNTGAYAVNYQDKWQHFISNWHKLAVFVDKHAKLDRSTMNDTIALFNRTMETLCQNIRAFSHQKLNHDRGDGTAYRTNQVEYLAYYDGPLPDNADEKAAMQAEIAMVKQLIAKQQAKPYALQI